MKMTLSLKIFFCALTVAMLTTQADTNSIVAGGLNLAATNPATGCNIVGTPGRLLATLSTDNQALACVICGDEWKKSGKHPMALQTVCGTGPLTKKQAELVDKALTLAISKPDTGCKVLGKFGRGLKVLTKDHRIQACMVCGDKWPNDPQAKAAVCRAGDTEPAATEEEEA